MDCRWEDECSGVVAVKTGMYDSCHKTKVMPA